MSITHMTALKVQNGSKFLRGVQILENISFFVNKGETLGLAGPSGSGKSTLLRCLQGLEFFDEGELKMYGSSGFMFQDFQLFPHFNVLENVLYALYRHHEAFSSFKNWMRSFQEKKLPLPHEALYQKGLEMLNRLHLSHHIHHYPHQLSGGQKQRVALARTLIIDPDIVFCDEPTSGLDIATIDDVIDLLRDLQAHNHLTLIVASHDLDFLTRLSQRILLIQNGKIKLDCDTRTLENPIHHLKSFYRNSECQLPTP